LGCPGHEVLQLTLSQFLDFVIPGTICHHVTQSQACFNPAQKKSAEADKRGIAQLSSGSCAARELRKAARRFLEACKAGLQPLVLETEDSLTEEKASNYDCFTRGGILNFPHLATRLQSSEPLQDMTSFRLMFFPFFF